MNRIFTVRDLDKMVKFLHALNQLSVEHGVVLDSLDDQRLIVDGIETPFDIKWDDDTTQYVSVVVSL